MFLEKLVKKCCVWQWCIYAWKLKNKKNAYTIISQNGDVHALLWTVSIWIDKQGNIVLIKNYRHAIDEIVWEIPRGWLEKWLTAEENALKEFKEEVGIEDVPEEVKYLGKFATDSWLVGGYVWYVVLKYEDFSKYNVWSEKDWSYESIYEVKYFSKNLIEEMIKNNDIKDNFTLVAWGLLKTYNLI